MANKSPIAVLYGNDGTNYIEVGIRSGIAVPSGQPGILGLGSDGTNTRYITVDASGRSVIVGAQSSGSAVTGNPVLIGGSDGTNARTLLTSVAGALRIDPTGTTTQPISATTLPLPTGAATETTLSGVLTTTAFQARINTLGQKTMANSTPVVLASDQASIPVSGTVTANIGTSGLLALEATQVKTTISPGTALGANTLTMVGGGVTTSAPAYSNGNINQLSLTTAGGLRVDLAGTTVPLPTGAATETTLAGRLADATFTTRINTLGQKTMTNSTPVVLASDQTYRLQSDRTGTGTIAVLNATVAADTTGAGTVVFNVIGTWTATLTVEATVDGTNWFITQGFIEPFSFATTSFFASATMVVNCGGFSQVRLRASAYTSGTASVAWSAGAGQSVGWVYNGNAASLKTEVQGPAASGQPASGFPVLVSGSDGTNVRTIRTATDGTVRVDPTGTTTQPVSISSIPLPTGAATEATLTGVLTTTAFQARINTLGQKTMANSTPIVISSDQSAIPATQSGTWNIGNITGTVSLPTGASTSALQTTGNSSLSSIDTKTPALGQATMANSTPVVIASNQSNLPANLVQVGGVAVVTGGIAGSQGIGGLAANAAALAGNPVLTGGSDGTAARSMLVDGSGRQVVVGAQADGSAVTGNPVLIAGSDGTNVQTLELRTTDILNGLTALVTRNIPHKKATFTVGAFGVAPANNKSMLAVFLAAGATNVLRLRKVFIRNVATAAVTGVATTFELRRCTADTAGTAVTPIAMDTADTALGANITVNTGGTVTDAAGNAIDRWFWSSDEWGPGALDTEGLEHSFQNVLPVWNTGGDPERELTIRTAGSQGWHIKCATNTTVGTWDIIFVFTQE